MDQRVGPDAPIPEDHLEQYARDWLRSTGIPFARGLEDRLVSQLVVLLTRFPGVAR